MSSEYELGEAVVHHMKKIRLYLIQENCLTEEGIRLFSEAIEEVELTEDLDLSILDKITNEFNPEGDLAVEEFTKEIGKVHGSYLVLDFCTQLPEKRL